MRQVFIELQRAAGFSNVECGRYLGISEGAVKDRRDGRFLPRRGELIALAVSGSDTLDKALAYIESLSQQGEESKKPA